MLEELFEDAASWTSQADSLAVFVTPTGIGTFRLPDRIGSSVNIADRFHVSHCCAPSRSRTLHVALSARA